MTVRAIEAVTEGPFTYKLQVVDGGREWTLHSLATGLRRLRRPSEDQIVDTLRALILWQAPYLFIREDHGDGTSWRGNVDHVFRIAGGEVVHLGTVAAQGGALGSQLRDGFFYDLYDRLEYTFLTSHAHAPRFTLVMEDRDGRFRVNVTRTWAEGQPRLAERQAELRALADHPERLRSEADRRRARGSALFCLAFTHYCDRYSEYLASLDIARAALGTVDDLVAEIATIVPGETAPSRDEILRSRPALVNLFKESPGTVGFDDDTNGGSVRLRWRPILPPSVGTTP